MKTRSLTAILIFLAYSLLVGLAVYVHKIFYDIFVLLLMIGAGMEMSHTIAKRYSKPLDFFILFNTLVGYIAFYTVSTLYNRTSGFGAYFIVLGLTFLMCLVFGMFNKNVSMRNVVATIFVILYPVTLLVYMLGLNYLPGNVFVAALLLMLLVSAFTDTLAYFVGITMRGPKLAPAISPKKTISGAIGGILGGILAAGLVLLCSIFGWLRVPVLSGTAALNIVHYFVLGALGSIATQLGDLIASYIKRQCNAKDFGRILPGHGGIMDRIDGVMLNAVLLYVYMMILAI